MKKIILFAFFAVSVLYANAQYNTPWTSSTLNTTQSGFLGIGTKSTSGVINTPLPNYNLHLHGTVDYINNDNQSSFAPNDTGLESGFTPMSSINYGKAVRLGFTNTVTGNGANDGTLLMSAQNDFYLWNRENGNIYLKANSAQMTFNAQSSAVWLGGSPSIDAKYGYFNIIAPRNGLYIETQNFNKKSLTINGKNNLTTAVEIYGTDQTNPTIKMTGAGAVEAKRFFTSIPDYDVSIMVNDNVSNNTNFKVFGSGEVYARKYVATLNNFPDYVFEKEYKLRAIPELKEYISINGKLPNLPSADEVAKKGLDIGEINRLLVEKVEELTLYIIQLEERINKIENTGSK